VACGDLDGRRGNPDLAPGGSRCDAAREVPRGAGARNYRGM